MNAAQPVDAWRRYAACRGLPAALFYPPPDSPAPEALAVCARCPVRTACEEHALAAGEEFGIWGGRTEVERARLQRCATAGRAGRHRRGPAPGMSDDDLIDLVWHLDPKQPAAEQIRRRLGVSIPTAYKYLHRAMRLGVIEQRGRHLYPTS